MSRALVPLLALIAATPAAAQSPYRAAIDRSPAYQTLADPGIQAALNLSAGQKAALARLPDDVLAEHKGQIEKDEAAAAKRAALLAALMTYDAKLESPLTAAQRTRLNHLAAQARLNSSAATAAFTAGRWAEPLDLTPAQRAKLAEVWKPKAAALQAEFPNYTARLADPATRKRYGEALARLFREAVGEFVAALDDGRRKKWKELLGEPSAATEALPGLSPTTGSALLRNNAATERLYWKALVLTQPATLDELKVEPAARADLAAAVKALQADAGKVGFVTTNMFVFTRAATARAEATLTPAQVERLRQLQFQMSGTAAFRMTAKELYGLTAYGGATPGHGHLLAKLNLTPAQAANLDRVILATEKQVRAVPRPEPWYLARSAESDADKAERQYRRACGLIEAAAVKEILATFDAGQLAAWKAQAGEPVDVSKFTSAFPAVLQPGRTPTLTVARSWWTVAQSRADYGEYAAALAALDEAIRLAPDTPAFFHQKAWLLATCPSEYVRDGKAAVAAARRALEAGQGPQFLYLDALAAALAEAGRFDEAVANQEKAVAALAAAVSAGGTVTVDGVEVNSRTYRAKFEQRLKLYREKKPFRTPPPLAEGA